MKTLLQKYSILVFVLSIFMASGTYANAKEFPGNIVFNFSDENDIDYWRLGNHGTGTDWSIEDGHFIASMGGDTKFRGDLMYNSKDGTNSKGTAPAVVFNTITDRYIAIKFIGDRPHGKLKFEMNTTGGSWINKGGQFESGALTGNIKTSNGNTIYYLDLSAGTGFTGESVEVNFLKFIVADAENPPFTYTVDWIATFPSITDIVVAKDIADDGEEDIDEPESVFPGNIGFSFSTDGNSESWRLGKHNGTEATFDVEDGYLKASMVLDTNGKYRADLMYNSKDGTNNKGTAPSLFFNTTTDRFLAIKFIGNRPHGVIKFEMQTPGNQWLNSGGQYQSGSLTGNIQTANGNTIYYLDLSANANFTGDFVEINLVKFIIADAANEPYSYTVDWIASFESVEQIQAYKDMQDDGENDLDEDFSTSAKNATMTSLYVAATESLVHIGNIMSESIINIYDLSGQRVLSTTSAGAESVFIPFSQKGTFVIEVRGKETTKMVKVVK